MGLLETQNFLARIYTDENLRREFLSAPEKIGHENDLSVAETGEIIEIFPDEINAFAESLIWKRLREVEKILPLTRHVLAKDFTALFRQYSSTFNPQSVKKHLEDAVMFSRFIERQAVSGIAKNIAKYERLNLSFNGENKRFSIAAFDFDIRRFRELAAGNNNNLQANIAPKKTFSVRFRFGRIEKQFIW